MVSKREGLSTLLIHLSQMMHDCVMMTLFLGKPFNQNFPQSCSQFDGLICFMGTHSFDQVFMSLFQFSWRRSISIFLLAPPFLFAVDAQIHWWDCAGERNNMFCTMLISISIAYELNSGIDLKCSNNCLCRVASLSPLRS